MALLVGVPFLFASLTGGFAGAIAGGGRENRTILHNAAIGFVAWLIAGTIVAGYSGGWPEELTVPWLFLTLVIAILIARFSDNRNSGPSPSEPKEPESSR